MYFTIFVFVIRSEKIDGKLSPARDIAICDNSQFHLFIIWNNDCMMSVRLVRAVLIVGNAAFHDNCFYNINLSLCRIEAKNPVTSKNIHFECHWANFFSDSLISHQLLKQQVEVSRNAINPWCTLSREMVWHCWE